MKDMNREQVIEQMAEKYREELEGKENAQLVSKDAIAGLREDIIENKMEEYREKLENDDWLIMDIKDELDNELDLIRDETIDKMVEQYQEKLKQMDDEDLAAA